MIVGRFALRWGRRPERGEFGKHSLEKIREQASFEHDPMGNADEKARWFWSFLFIKVAAHFEKYFFKPGAAAAPYRCSGSTFQETTNTGNPKIFAKTTAKELPKPGTIAPKAPDRPWFAWKGRPTANLCDFLFFTRACCPGVRPDWERSGPSCQSNMQLGHLRK